MFKDIRDSTSHSVPIGLVANPCIFMCKNEYYSRLKFRLLLAWRWGLGTRTFGTMYLLKRVLVQSDGQVYRATDAEIVQDISEVPEEEGVLDLSGPEYLYAVKQMFPL